jgi:hypothetical protein
MATEARVSQIFIDVVRTAPGNARVSQLFADVLRTGPGNARVSQVFIDVLTFPTPAPPEPEADIANRRNLSRLGTRAGSRQLR